MREAIDAVRSEQRAFDIAESARKAAEAAAAFTAANGAAAGLAPGTIPGVCVPCPGWIGVHQLLGISKIRRNQNAQGN